MKPRASVPLLLIAFCAGRCADASGASAADAPDLIVHHGRVVTVDRQFSIAEAMAVKGDRILAVGSNADVQKLAGPDTRQLDLAGRTVMPGLIDSHVHATGAAMYEFDHPVPEMDTIADLLHYVKGRADVLEDGEWILISQVFITRLRDQRYPTRKELDQVAPNNPVLFATGPDASVNSLALRLSGIDKDSQMPEGQKGRIERDPATGEPTGILRSCTGLIKSKSPSKAATSDERYERVKQLFRDYNAAGLTSVADRDAGDGAINLYRKLRDNGDLTCRVFVNYSVDAGEPINAIEGRILRAAGHPLHEYDNMLWVRGIKVYLDGGMLTGSAFMRQPWGVSEIYSIADPEYRGLQFIPDERLFAIARLALKNGLQMTAHAQGDGAVLALVNAYERVNQEFPVREHRPCVTHGSFMSPEAIEKMKSLGIVADLQPAWLWLDGATLTKQFGDERMRHFHPYKSLAEAGVIAGGGSDHMQKIGGMRSVNPYNPFLGMWITLSRVPKRADQPLHPEERLSREQAIRLYTINNAFLTFEEKEKGSLETGKLADFLVLDRDILTCPEAEVKEIRPLQTYLGGRLAHEAMSRE